MKKEEYWQKKVRAELSSTGEVPILLEMTQMLSACKRSRQEWDMKAKWGRQVQRYDFSFIDKHFARKKPSTDIWGINFVATNIQYSINAAIASDIRISLATDTGEITKPQMLMEAKLNYAVDKFNLLRKSDQALWDLEYTGMAYARTGWNPKNQDSTWFNGKPDYRILMPEDVWLDPAIQAKDKSDCQYLFYQDRYITKNLRKLSPELHKLVDDHYTNLEMTNNSAEEITIPGVVTVMHFIYKRTFQVTKRAIVNEENPRVKWFLEEDFEQALQEFTGVVNTPETNQEMLRYKDMAEIEGETSVLPEGLRVSKPMESEVSYWFEIMFMPELNIIVSKPSFLGKENPVSIMHGNYDPASPYSFGNAWKMKAPLEMSIVNMTIQFFDTVKKHKPIISIMPGSIVNEKEVRERWGDPNLVIRWNNKFFQNRSNANLNPRDCLYAVQFPQSGRMQLLLDEKLQRAAEEAQSTPSVSKGIQPYAGMPAESVQRLQEAASIGSKNSFIEYEQFIKHTVEVLKELFIRFVNYKHKMLAPDEAGNSVLSEINYDSDTMLENAEDTIVEVMLEENSETQKMIREQKLRLAYQTTDESGMPLITSDDYLEGILPQDFERLKNSKLKMLESNPVLLRQAMGEQDQISEVED